MDRWALNHTIWQALFCSTGRLLAGPALAKKPAEELPIDVRLVATFPLGNSPTTTRVEIGHIRICSQTE